MVVLPAIERLLEPEIQEDTCDGNDLGIDSIRIDDEDVVHFYSFKNPERGDKAFPDGDVDKTLAGLRGRLETDLAPGRRLVYPLGMDTRKRYPSDLTDLQWDNIEHLFPRPTGKGGRPRTYPVREIVNAIFYLARSGCAWRNLPHDFPPWKTISYYFYTWRDWGSLGSGSTPSYAWISGDWTSGRYMPMLRHNGQPNGQDHRRRRPQGVRRGEKKIGGRKRHILVDTLGLLWSLVVLPADVQDRDGAKVLLERVRGLLPRLRVIWADGAYTALIDWVQKQWGWVLTTILRPWGSKKAARICPNAGLSSESLGGGAAIGGSVKIMNTSLAIVRPGSMSAPSIGWLESSHRSGTRTNTCSNDHEAKNEKLKTKF